MFSLRTSPPARTIFQSVTMRLVVPVLTLCALARAQTPASSPDPAYKTLSQAYEHLRAKDYDKAIVSFEKAIEAAPTRPSVRKDLAYTLLKAGETEAARDQFGEAVRLDQNDTHIALEYAFLCYETKKQAEARRIFDRIRRTGDPASRATAERAFLNVDTPLRLGIERWTKALELNPGNFSAHYELAQLAEQRDEFPLSAEHYLKAWRLLPGRKSVLLDLGRVWKALNRIDEANAALLAASRCGESRAAEGARELQLITDRSAEDLLSAAQLGFLYLARNEREKAMPLLERVMNGTDLELANRVRAALQ